LIKRKEAMSAIKRKGDASKVVLESRNVQTYKKLLNIFGGFCDEYPASSVDRLFELMVEKGIKILPSDKRAMDILNYLICECDSVSMRVQKILNMRFRNLPAELKPITKSGRRHEIAFWCIDGAVFDQVRRLLNFESGSKGFWSDAEGKKVQLLNTKEKSD
jgi:hypothetical protein